MFTGICSVDDLVSVTCSLWRVRLRQRECVRALQTAPPPKNPGVETSGSKEQKRKNLSMRTGSEAR